MTGSDVGGVCATPAPENVLTYVEDMLGELAEMATKHGNPALATTILVAALEAARASSRARRAANPARP